MYVADGDKYNICQKYSGTGGLKNTCHYYNKDKKCLKPERNIQIGDLVLVVENTPRNYWNLGRIVHVERDSSDMVRIVKVNMDQLP
jgi:hypothetical protein